MASDHSLESQRKTPTGNHASYTEECASDLHRHMRPRQDASSTSELGAEESNSADLEHEIRATKRPISENPSCDGSGQNAEGLTTEDQCSNVSGSLWFKKYGQASAWLLKQNYDILESNGNFSDIDSQLYQNNILSRKELEVIEEDKVRYKQMSRLLKILSRKSPDLIEKFFYAIGKADANLYEQLNWPVPTPEIKPRHEKDRQLPDELNSIQTVVSDWYKSRLSTIQPLSWNPMLEMDIDYVFSNLKIVDGHKESLRIPRQHRSTNDIKTLENLCERIFEVGSRTITFVQGAAGMGKSTLCRKLAFLWATHNHCIYNHQLDLVLLVEAVSVVSDANQCYGIIGQLFPEDLDVDKGDIPNIIKKCEEKCLLIIDGVDELNREGKSVVIELLDGKFLRQARVVLTGRPESVPDFIKYANVHLEIRGFSKENALEYVRKFFRNDETELRNKLLNALENDDEIAGLAVNPFQTLLLCLRAQENIQKITPNIYDIVEELTRSFCKRYLSKPEVEKNISETDLFLAAGKLAKVGLEKGELKFEESKIKELFPGELGEHLLKSGVLTTDFTISRLCMTKFWSFPHKIMQEYLCAFHLVTSGEDISHDFTQTVDHFYQWKETFFARLRFCRKRDLSIRSHLSKNLENACRAVSRNKFKVLFPQTRWKERGG